MIISASPEFLIAPIANQLGVRYIASKLNPETGTYDGLNCYGDEKVVEALLKAKFLSLGTWHFVSAIFEQPLEAFRCYTTRQLNPERLPY